MANVGQIIYNLEDYNSSGGYISTANGNTTQTITSATDPDYETNKIDIFTRNLVEIYASKQFSKVGIQAPPGTKLVMNTNKNIMIGRTGVYELDEDIAITGLYFLRPKNYILDTETTEKNLSDGKKKLEARCYWGLSVEQEVMDNPKLLKRLESLNNITFDDDIKASILDIEAVCELIRMIGAGYVNGIVFGPTIMPSKPYLELKVLEELCKHMGCDTVFDLSAIKAFKTFEMDDSIEEMFHSIECEMLELLLEGWTESLLGFE